MRDLYTITVIHKNTWFDAENQSHIKIYFIWD